MCDKARWRADYLAWFDGFGAVSGGGAGLRIGGTSAVVAVVELGAMISGETVVAIDLESSVMMIGAYVVVVVAVVVELGVTMSEISAVAMTVAVHCVVTAAGTSATVLSYIFVVSGSKSLSFQVPGLHSSPIFFQLF